MKFRKFFSECSHLCAHCLLLEVEFEAGVAVGWSGCVGVDAAEGVFGDALGGDAAI